ncbi:YSC84-related protein [Luteolibacter marinus]|uniref:lipid-binding SYLF domain-containing protein n=1 Tax=Luteolibacter marinus TaxID=2776705 RepID=UPI0018696B11|nr:lipid-binding SYLF domain-containing protein [Luteolibacter marinus]
MKLNIIALAMAVATALVPGCASGPVATTNAAQASAADISSRSRTALKSLYASDSRAKSLGRNAKAVLVFPEILRGGFVISGQGGNGTLFTGDGKVDSYYQSFAASYGFEAGVQKFGYALFLMDDDAIQNLKSSKGWELGSAPNLTVLDKGTAGNISTATMDKGTVAMFFDQRGLMGGVSLQTSKITRIYPGP